MNETEFTLKEIVERMEFLFDIKLDSEEKFSEYAMRSLLNDIYAMKGKGYTVVYYPWDDITGKPRVAGRFKTTREKDEFLEMIHLSDSGWIDEELMTVSVIDDYNYLLPR